MPNLLETWSKESAAKTRGKAIWSNADYGVILMRQHRKDASEASQRFAVIYGKQIDEQLTYADACSKLGQALLHGIACDGLID